MKSLVTTLLGYHLSCREIAIVLLGQGFRGSPHRLIRAVM